MWKKRGGERKKGRSVKKKERGVKKKAEGCEKKGEGCDTNHAVTPARPPRWNDIYNAAELKRFQFAPLQLYTLLHNAGWPSTNDKNCAMRLINIPLAAFSTNFNGADEASIVLTRT